MRVLHAVTLHSPSHAFGGPVRVALNLAKGLRARGHEARLLALGEGFPDPWPTSVEGVPAKLFPARRLLPLGFSGMTSPALLASAGRLVRDADVVHVHLARDLVTLPVALAALRARKPLVLQTHGMVDPSGKLLAKVLDAVAVRRVLRGADAVLYLTPHEREGLDAVVGAPALASAVRLVNGTPAQEERPSPSGAPRCCTRRACRPASVRWTSWTRPRRCWPSTRTRSSWWRDRTRANGTPSAPGSRPWGSATGSPCPGRCPAPRC